MKEHSFAAISNPLVLALILVHRVSPPIASRAEAPEVAMCRDIVTILIELKVPTTMPLTCWALIPRAIVQPFWLLLLIVVYESIRMVLSHVSVFSHIVCIHHETILRILAK